MADDIRDGPDMIGQRFGACERVTPQTGDMLPQCAIETLEVMGFPGVLRDGCVLRSWNHPCIDFIVIRRERRLLTVHRGQVGPPLFRTVATAPPCDTP